MCGGRRNTESLTHLLCGLAASDVESYISDGLWCGTCYEDPLNVPMHCGLVQHTVTTLLGAGLGLEGFSSCCC